MRFKEIQTMNLFFRTGSFFLFPVVLIENLSICSLFGKNRSCFHSLSAISELEEQQKELIF